MVWPLLFFLVVVLPFPQLVMAQTPAPDTEMHHMEHAHDNMRMDMEGMVMNENLNRLPQDCPAIAGTQEIIVRAGKKYAQQFNGTMFTYDQREWQVGPCTKVTVTLVNEDSVRHQWMIHGLPRYLYPEGMFHLEVNGPGRKTGTFIVSSAKKTYLVHCDVAQHTEKGMKAQLKVGGGNGDLPSIPGITSPHQPDTYPEQWSLWMQGLTFAAGLVGAGLIVRGFGLSR
jgi:hypothetical protein